MTVDQAALNALTAQWSAQKAGLDDQENRYRINYNNALDDLKRQNTANTLALNQQASDNGLQQSGIAVQNQVKGREDYNRAVQRAEQAQQLNISTIARKRLEADAAYHSQAPLL